MRLSEIGYKSLIIAGALAFLAMPVSASVTYVVNHPTKTGETEVTDYHAFSQKFISPINTNDTTIRFWLNGNAGQLIIYHVDYPNPGNMSQEWNTSGNIIGSSEWVDVPSSQNFIAGETYLLTNTNGNLYVGNNTDNYGGFYMDNSFPPGNNLNPITMALSIYSGTPEITPPVAFTTPTSTAGNLLAAISDQFADPGFLTFAILAASIVLGFWGMEKLLALMPKDKT